MRGALIVAVPCAIASRIIPADAGSTCGTCIPTRSGRDHPRGCGEHAVLGVYRVFAVGSSPRMRGAPGPMNSRPSNRGIIPADAGSTGTSGRFWKSPGDHPRGCGEHRTVIADGAPSEGSSPRMRGAHRAEHQRAEPQRIIPADAGSTRAWLPGRDRHRDHPRGCGEHSPGKSQLARPQGSSPRMRGAPTGGWRTATPARIIPADAGSTWWPSYCSCSAGDHPRGCGEHFEAGSDADRRLGSSPRMRGALAAGLLDSGFGRIIPADAGSTRLPPCRAGSPWDHPRGCGEHKARDRPDTLSPGSSPRMRGALGDDPSIVLVGRIIPADAGSTTGIPRTRSVAEDHPRGCGEH